MNLQVLTDKDIQNLEDTFRAGHQILAEFEWEGHQVFLYRLNDMNRIVYVTGAFLGFEIGWKYDEKVGHIIQVSYIADEMRNRILAALGK